LAGPVVAAAVILAPHTRIVGVRDSKKLSPAQRVRLAKKIRRRALCWAIGAAGHRFIDRHNIHQATFQAMRRAIARLSVRPSLVVADGWKIPELDLPCQGILQGDNRSLSIACASIVAKVYRDQLMARFDSRFPGYQFAQHKGYATPGHLRALQNLGASPIHRGSFEPVRRIVNQRVPVRGHNRSGL